MMGYAKPVSKEGMTILTDTGLLCTFSLEHMTCQVHCQRVFRKLRLYSEEEKKEIELAVLARNQSGLAPFLKDNIHFKIKIRMHHKRHCYTL